MRIRKDRPTNGDTMKIPAAHFVIMKFGGLSKTARALDLPVTTVQGWKDRKVIPTDHWFKVIAALKAIDVDFSVEDFLREHKVKGEAA